MATLYILSGLICAALFIYLIFALVKPEWF